MPLVERIAETIAESRYEAWDSHAQGPNALTWQQYRAEDPLIAEGIYLEDGRRDALRVLAILGKGQ